MSRTHVWLEFDEVERHVCVEYDYQPPEPDTNPVVTVKITGTWINNMPITLSDDQLADLTADILNDMAGYQE